MNYQIITTGLILVFFNIGFIGGLQRLMHWLDLDIEAKHLYPWRTELVYVAYQLMVVGLLLWASRETSGLIQLVLIDCMLLVALSFTNALKTLPAILTAAIANVALVLGFLGLYQWPVMLTTGLYVLWLIAQERFFAPFDEHMGERLLTDLISGLTFWGLLQWQWRLSAAALIVVSVSFVVALSISFFYLYVLRREHIVDRSNAQSVRYDGLTQTLNWVTFRDELRQHCDAGEKLSLLAIDIDDFKAIDETYGQKISNQVLIIVVNALQDRLELVAPGAEIARTGGDVLMVILPQTDSAELQTIAQACQAHVHQLMMPVKDAALQVTVSVGGAYRHDDDDARTLYRRTDAHLIAAKHQTAGRLVVDD